MICALAAVQTATCLSRRQRRRQRHPCGIWRLRSPPPLLSRQRLDVHPLPRHPPRPRFNAWSWPPLSQLPSRLQVEALARCPLSTRGVAAILSHLQSSPFSVTARASQHLSHLPHPRPCLPHRSKCLPLMPTPLFPLRLGALQRQQVRSGKKAQSGAVRPRRVRHSPLPSCVHCGYPSMRRVSQRRTPSRHVCPLTGVVAWWREEGGEEPYSRDGNSQVVVVGVVGVAVYPPPPAHPNLPHHPRSRRGYRSNPPYAHTVGASPMHVGVSRPPQLVQQQPQRLALACHGVGHSQQPPQVVLRAPLPSRRRCPPSTRIPSLQRHLRWVCLPCLRTWRGEGHHSSSLLPRLSNWNCSSLRACPWPMRPLRLRHCA